MPVETDLDGRRLGGRYRLEHPIAAGGMGTVWRGMDETLDRPVAVKTLHEHLAADPDLFDRFRLEAIAAARLSHPAVVRIFDTGIDDGVCYIVMELLDARALSSVLDEGPLEPGEAVRIALRVLEALGHAHGAGVIHRDVKPGNVLVGADLVKVADFGIAKAAFAGNLTTTGRLLGTAKYLAPEQVEGGDVDGRADLYATGILLYEMLTGRVPFDAPTDLATAMLRLSSSPAPPRSLRAGIPRALEEVVLRALEREPADRFASAEEMATALQRFAHEGEGAPREGIPREHTGGARGSFFRSWMLVPAVILSMAAAVIAAGIALGRLEFGGPLGIRAREEPARDGGQTLRIRAVQDHDPEGDGGEHPERVAFAWDSEISTFWETEKYASPDLGGRKNGVGLLLDLGRSQEVRALAIRSPLPGWRFEVRASDDPESLGRAVPGAFGERTFVAESRTRIVLRPVRARYVLVWITALAEAAEAGGGGYRARIAEVRVSGG